MAHTLVNNLQLMDLNDDVLLHVFSFIADVPYESSPFDGKSTLTHIIPRLCKRTYELCAVMHFSWMDGLNRLIRNTDLILWFEGVKEFIQRNAFSDDKTLDDVKIRAMGEQAFYERAKQGKAVIVLDHETTAVIIQHAREVFMKQFQDGHAMSDCQVFKGIMKWIRLHHMWNTSPLFCMRDESVNIGTSIGLHLFEPRYRLMIREIMEPFHPTYRRGKRFETSHKPKFIYAFHGHISRGSEVAIVDVEQCIIYQDSRADITLTVTAFAIVESVWERPRSRGLFEARVLKIGREDILQRE